MTWAPRGIFSTTSARVGRSTRKWRPVEPVIVRPSSPPMIVVVRDDPGMGVEGGPGDQA